MVTGAILANNYIVWWIAQLVALAILVFLALRWRPGFLGGRTIGETINAALDARAAQIQDQLEAAERSRQEAARIREQTARDVAKAREESEEIVRRAAQTSEAIQRDIEARAREEYERIVGQAKSEIEYERRQAVLALRHRAADIVVDAAEQVVARDLDPETDRRIIEDSVAQLGNGTRS
ncbi:MAG TPA: F0F1 ATP synthase subunit B [Chloroflexota bacterium]